MKENELKFSDFLFVILISLISGILDAFTYIFNNCNFCLMQTGNFIKFIIYLINGQINEGLYSLMLFLVFFVGCFLFSILFAILKKKTKLNLLGLSSLILTLLLLPLIYIQYDSSSIFNVSNIINGVFLSLAGSLILLQFCRIKDINFTPSMMTNNVKIIGEEVGNHIVFKNKDNLIRVLILFIILISFGFGITIVCLFNKFVDAAINIKCIDLILFLLCVILIVVSYIVNKKEEKDE